MQNKLRQLIIIALRRNHITRDLPIAVTIHGYDVILSGEVPSKALRYEVINTVEAVSPHLRVESRISADNEESTASVVH
ncbi:MAG TPA: hypothetical protein VJZ27_01800 [Aggregatilineales bacterium]|nr:hypothetical protein [Aggregatilineales bacterium]